MPRTPLTRGLALLASAVVGAGVGTLTACSAATGPSDTTPPVVTLTSPENGTSDLLGELTLAAEATDSAGIAVVYFLVDGSHVASDFAEPYQTTVSTADWASGVHRVAVVARDHNGNESASPGAVVTFGGDVALPAGFTQSVVAPALGAQATAIIAAPDGRLFVTEKSGAVRVIKGGALLAQPFVAVPVLLGSERGLIGIALSPGFGTTGYVYLHYTTAEDGAHNRISRFAALGDVAASSEEVLVDLPALSTAQNHNGGAMAFGPDGKLYVAVGENANGTLAAILTSPFGKILRLEPDGSIPGDNPFAASTTGINRAIWAKGLRNPYTFAFEPGASRMFINDVGQGTWEEVNVGRAGADYGWPSTEGPTTAAGIDAPLFAYRHAASPTLFEGAAIVGAAFYRPATPSFGPAFVGDYFFADFVAGWIHFLDADDEWAPSVFAHTGGSPTNLAVGADGALYVTMGTRVDRIARSGP